MDPSLLDAIAKDLVGGEGRGMLNMIKEGTIKDEIQLIQTDADDGPESSMPRTAEEATSLRRKTRAESNIYKSMAARARSAGVDRAILVEADNAAKRMADKQDPDKGREYDSILARERKIAMNEPVKYLRETAGGKVELSDQQKTDFEQIETEGNTRSRRREGTDRKFDHIELIPRAVLDARRTQTRASDLAERLETATTKRDMRAANRDARRRQPEERRAISGK